MLIITCSIDATTATFKLRQGQLLNGQLLLLSRTAMVVMLNNQLISLDTQMGSAPAICLLDSGASYNFLALDWYKTNGLEFDTSEQFDVCLADGQEVPAIGKLNCLVDLGPLKIALTFFVLDCNAPCILGIPFLQIVNPIIDWASRSVQVYSANGLSPTKVVYQGTKPQCQIVSAKQFDKGLYKGQYLYSLILRQIEPKGQLNFTHRNAFGTTGGDEAYDTNLVK